MDSLLVSLGLFQPMDEDYLKDILRMEKFMDLPLDKNWWLSFLENPTMSHDSISLYPLPPDAAVKDWDRLAMSPVFNTPDVESTEGLTSRITVDPSRTSAHMVNPLLVS